MIPEGWEKKRLGDIANIQIGGTPSRSNPEYWANSDDGYAWLSIRDMSKGWEIYETSERITQLGVDRSNVKPVPPNTLLLSFKLSLGKVCFSRVPLFTNEAIAAIYPRSDSCSSEFLFWALPSSVDAVDADTAVKGKTLNKAKLQDIAIDLPPLGEQLLIAKVLGQLRSARAFADQALAQTRRLKQALLHQLLTKGIDENGKPHTRFKKTEIGEIPEEWEVVALEALLADKRDAMRSGPFGSALRKSEWAKSGVALLGIDNVQSGFFRPIFKRFITPQKFESLKRYQVYPDDVMVTIMGTVGRCCLVPGNIGKAISSKHVWTMTIDKKKYSPYLLCAQINEADWIRKQFAEASQGGIMTALSSGTLKSTLVPVPPISVQQRIETILKLVDQAVFNCQQEIDVIARVSQVVASDLLSGRVRVKDLKL